MFIMFLSNPEQIFKLLSKETVSVFRLIHVKCEVLAVCLLELENLFFFFFFQICFGKDG